MIFLLVSFAFEVLDHRLDVIHSVIIPLLYFLPLSLLDRVEYNLLLVFMSYLDHLSTHALELVLELTAPILRVSMLFLPGKQFNFKLLSQPFLFLLLLL